jgi:hypothetical protein
MGQNTMKKIIGAALALAFWATASSGVVVTVDGVQWEVTSEYTFVDNEPPTFFADQPWYDVSDQMKAVNFASAVGSSLGLSNSLGALSPFFVSSLEIDLFRAVAANQSGGTSFLTGSGNDFSNSYTYATASRVNQSVPEVTAAGGLAAFASVFLFGTFLRERRRPDA